MKVQRKGGVATRKRLLAAAGRVFKEKGYHGATIAEICRVAEANIAAVNYHFSDKETLYLEAMRLLEGNSDFTDCPHQADFDRGREDHEKSK